jgi:hypothetical protein
MDNSTNLITFINEITENKSNAKSFLNTFLYKMRDGSGVEICSQIYQYLLKENRNVLCLLNFFNQSIDEYKKSEKFKLFINDLIRLRYLLTIEIKKMFEDEIEKLNKEKINVIGYVIDKNMLEYNIHIVECFPRDKAELTLFDNQIFYCSNKNIKKKYNYFDDCINSEIENDNIFERLYKKLNEEIYTMKFNNFLVNENIFDSILGYYENGLICCLNLKEYIKIGVFEPAIQNINYPIVSDFINDHLHKKITKDFIEFIGLKIGDDKKYVCDIIKNIQTQFIATLEFDNYHCANLRDVRQKEDINKFNEYYKFILQYHFDIIRKIVLLIKIMVRDLFKQ